MNPAGNSLSAVLRAAVFVAAAAVVSGASAGAQNRTDEREDFRNTTYLPAGDDEMKTFLFLADEAARAGNGPEAVANLLRALRRGGDALVPFGERTYVTGRTAAMRRLAALPPETFALYLDSVAEESVSAFEAAARARDSELLRETAERYPLTRASFAALRLLGDLALERGDCFESANRYRRYIAAAAAGKEQAAPDLGAVRLALYTSLLRCGRLDEAASFRPAGPVAVAGRTLDPAALEAAAAAAAPAARDEAAEGGWPTRGGARGRPRLPEFDAEGLRLLWSYPLRSARGGDEENDLFSVPATLAEKRSYGARQPPATVYPVVAGGRVYAFDWERLHVLDLETGEPVFGPLPWDWSLLFGDEAPEFENVTYSASLSENLLFVTLNHRGRRGSFRAEHSGTILALDVAREGYCLWKRGGTGEENEVLASAAFSGAPLFVEGRVYVMATRHTATAAEAWLLCFNAASGETIFERFLCSGAEVQKFADRSDVINPAARDRVELGAPAVEHAGTIYCCTNLGVAAAVDAFTGGFLWAFKYNRLFAQDPTTYERAFYLDTGGWEDCLPFFQNGCFVFAPSDSRYLYTLAPEPDADGYIVLDDPVEKGRFAFVIGSDGERYYFAAREGGRNFIAATDPSGALLWETDLFEKEDRIAGQPLLTRSAIFVPTERYIYRIDLASEGLITGAFPAPVAAGAEGEKRPNLIPPVFGNIITTKDRLLSVSETRILAFAPK